MEKGSKGGISLLLSDTSSEEEEFDQPSRSQRGTSTLHQSSPLQLSQPSQSSQGSFQNVLRAPSPAVPRAPSPAVARAPSPAVARDPLGPLMHELGPIPGFPTAGIKAIPEDAIPKEHPSWALWEQWRRERHRPPERPLPYYQDPFTSFPPVPESATKRRVPGTNSEPVSRAASPSLGPPRKKAAKTSKKTDAEKEEIDRTQKLIDNTVNHFSKQYMDRIECAEESDPKSKNSEDQEFNPVAKYLTVFKGKPKEEKLDLATFNSKQIRKLAQNCGVRGGGNMTLYKARKAIAQVKNMGTIYNDLTISNPKITADQRKKATWMRAINACFLPEVIGDFKQLNDTKGRTDYEKANGGNPVKAFWIGLSNLVNDPTNNERIGVVLHCQEGEDQRMRDMNEVEECNLNCFNQQTHESCQQLISDVMKARETCLSKMHQSGQGSNDMWNFCTNTTFTKLRQSSAPVPAVVVYYCHLFCVEHPGIDGKFAAFMDKNQKSDSEVDLTGSAGDGSDAKKGGKSKTVDTLVKTLTETSDSIRSMHEQTVKTSDNRKNEEAETRHWAEYQSMSGRFLGMAGDPRMLPLMRNLAIRIKKLEALVGIAAEFSVTLGHIPSEVTTGADGETATSDVTGSKHTST
ncbi:hypothetical protein SEMRO_3517_G348800.1 [Seminavis robusta]|uniref:Uncharacterized protein n=1 Tax=Seminavis robusta TaxID=568900 RepID=A0A9N8I076_9STRA|nr:hypothetical protein SEMRO_3517_G348800.1 [Seminavis robusta]|eukprot:Sro3517_g348800.1 n/a (631) ;mRNA; r:3142-5034